MPTSPDLRLIRADNASAMTGTGTNTYLLGRDAVVVIDPGPDLAPHRTAILTAIGEARVAAILVTHCHLDHSALARPLADATGARVLAFGPAGSGRSDRMTRLAAAGLAGGGEGFDLRFVPDRRLRHAEVLTLGDLTIEVLHLPGHTGCHLGFAVGDRLFAGDHVMGWSTSLVSPPDGDMGDYVASLRALAARRWSVIYPGHGTAVTDPAARLAALLAHRASREAEILAALRGGPASATQLSRQIYTTTPPALLPAASRNVLAHLIDLWDRDRVAAPTPFDPNGRFTLT